MKFTPHPLPTLTYRSYIWCHQEPTRSAGTHQGIHDATSQWMCCGKWSALWTSYVILKRVPAHERKSISQNLFTFGPMLIGTFLLKWGWGIPRKSLWHRFWDILYIAAIYVEEFNQNPYWCFDKILFSIRYWYNLEYGTFSNIFKKKVI
jgi:hypothetical protein